MRVEEFPRPKADNRRGIHWSASVYHPAGSALDFWIGELQAMNVKWVKLLDDGGGSALELCRRLLAADVMPVVRLYRLEPNPGHIGPREEETVRRLVAEGVRYFEANSEPDLPAEWQGGRLPSDWLDVVVANFIVDADKIIGMGGLPAFPAMGVGAAERALEAVVRRGRADLFSSGAWVAIHNYVLNRPLDYPYDPVNQEGAPVTQEEYERLGPWAWEGRSREQINAWRAADKSPGATLQEDTACFLAFQLLDEKITQTLGHKAPILSTEGGPVVGWKADRRYPRIDPHAHAACVVGINDFLQGGRRIHGRPCPDNYLAACHWLLANYRLGFMAPGWESSSWYSDWWNADFHLSGELPAVAAVKAMPNIPVDLAHRAVGAGCVPGAAGDEAPADLAGQPAAGAHAAAAGAFRPEDLAAGAIDPAPGHRSVVRGRVADGAGRPRGDILLTLRREEQPLAQARTADDGAYAFVDLPAGVFGLEAAGMGVVADNIVLDGQREYVADVLWAEPGPRSILQGRVLADGGAPVGGVPVYLMKDGAEAARTQTDEGGAFRFLGLAGAAYALGMAEGIPPVGDIQVDEDATVTRNIVLPAGPDKLLEHYLLFAAPPAPGAPSEAEARLILLLATDYLIRTGATGGFSVEEAAQAKRVTILGDAAPAAVEGRLAALGCAVTRLAGDGFAVAELLEHRLADGKRRAAEEGRSDEPV